jgi:peptidoglycan hydrolase CwlO-like protein
LPALPDKLLTPEEEELQSKKAALAELEAKLADRELELAALLADLAHFEKHYLQTVGRRYALLDELKAKIAEIRSRQDPEREDVRQEATKARAQAQESAKAVGQENTVSPPADDSASQPKLNRPPSLDKLYRLAAKLLHPDLTLDEEEKKKRHRLMAEVNDAYARGDEDRIRAILNEWHASPDNVAGDGPGAELIRVIRKIAQVEKRLKAIAAEMERAKEAEMFKLKQQVEVATKSGRDLLKELVERLDREIAAAREELARAAGAPQP